MGKRVDVRGKKFGTLRPQRFAFSKNGSYWICLCDCGNKRSIRLDQLTKTKNPSCGCQKQRNITECQIKHGFRNSNDGRRSEYTAWTNMKGRCFNKNDKGYPTYGGRGITVCKRWLSFKNFISDMGDKPEGMTLERNNSNGNYEPKNCRWASWHDQALSRRKTEKFLESVNRNLDKARLAKARL